MKTNLIQYQPRPEYADDNERLIRAVFDALRQAKPTGMRYLAMRHDDGSFTHLVGLEDGQTGNPLRELEAFKQFLSGLDERVEAPVTLRGARIIGNYGWHEGR